MAIEAKIFADVSNTVRLAILALFVSCMGSLKAEQTLPAYKGHVNDYANVLSAAQIKQLDEILFAYEDSTSSQIAVVLEPSANGLAAIDRAMFLARGWGVGQKNKNNGILLYIAINDRKFFTVTADQMQDKLGASRLGQIENDFLVPNLRNQDYFTAIAQTTQAFEQALMGKFKGKATRKRKSGTRGWVSIVVAIVLLGPYSWVVLAVVVLAAEAAEVDLVAEDLVIGVVLAVAVDSMEAVPAEVGNQPAFPLGIF